MHAQHTTRCDAMRFRSPCSLTTASPVAACLSSCFLFPLIALLLHPCTRVRAALQIRVIGVQDTLGSFASTGSARGSVQSLTLADLLQSHYTDEYSDASQPLWVQIENASASELERIGEHFGLHPLTVEAVQTRHTREKLEIFQNYLFLVFHALHGGAQSMAAPQPDWGAPRHREDVCARTAGVMTTAADADENGAAAGGSDGQEPVHEGSALLAGNKATARYYGEPLRNRLLNGGTPQPSPAPPRRHRPTLSVPAAQHPNISPSPSYVNRGSGGASSGAFAAGGGSMEDPSRAVPMSPHGGMLERFRVNPEQVLMPGSPQSVSDANFLTSSDEDSDSDSDSESDSDSDECTDGEQDGQGGRSASVSERNSASPSPHPTPGGQEERALRDVDKSLGCHSGAAKSAYREPATARSVPAISAATAASLRAEREPLRTAPIKLVVFPHLVLSFHASGLETVKSVARRLERVYSSNVESTAWIIHAVLDSITDSLLPVVNGTAMEVDALEELIYVLSGSEHRDLLKRMGMTRRRLGFLRQRLWSKRDILMSLIGKVAHCCSRMCRCRPTVGRFWALHSTC